MLKTGSASQASLFTLEELSLPQRPFPTQLLKWIGNKQKQADTIIGHFPNPFGTYFEPFLGSGGVLGVLAPERAVASDSFLPLMEIWQLLHEDKERLKSHYADRYALIETIGKEKSYEQILSSYNARPNGADLVFCAAPAMEALFAFAKLTVT